MVERSQVSEEQATDGKMDRELVIELDAISPEVSPENRELLAWLEGWLAHPDELGSDWWDAFEQELRDSRVTFEA